MQIVIDIPEAIYNMAKHTNILEANADALAECIRNGTVLPDNHGRIGDLDRLQKAFRQNVVGAAAFDDLFNNAPTILEAKEQTE